MNINRLGRIDLSIVKYVKPENPLRLSLGDVLFNNTNSPDLVGKTAPILDDAEVAYSNHMTRVRPADGVSCRFMAHQIHYLWMTGYFKYRCVKHVNQASVSSTSLSDTVPFLVAPASEQQRIVAEIEKQFSRLDAGVAALRRVDTNLKRYKASVLKAACTGALTADWRASHHDVVPASKLLDRILRERRRRWEEAELAKMTAKGKPPKDDKWKAKYKEPVAPQIDDLPELPGTWCWITAEQITPYDRSAAYGVLQPGPDLDDGIEFVRVCDIREGAIRRDQLKRIGPKIAARYPRTKLQGGEVLVTLVGTIGRSAVVPADLAGANTARAVGVIPISDGFHARFVELCFRNPNKVRELTGKAHEVARKTLNLEDVRATCIPFAPFDEQAAIVETVEDLMSIVQAAETAVEQNVSRASRLRQSILKDAFEGELVEQDPADEPAAALLDRIRAEREKRAADSEPTRVSASRRKGK